MSKSRFVAAVLVGFIWVALLPAAALAQSAIAGQVSDNTGGVLPGVTVEAASPVLIEKVRTAITDGQGRYTLTDLRPGTYAVTFSLAGFRTFVRDGLELPGDFTATVNAQLAVGAIEETVTVTGESPVVNIQSAARTQVITREVLDALPTPRNTQSFGYLMPGVRLSKPDVGGAQQMEQVNMRVHGASNLHTTMQIDGMLVTPAFADGAIQNYINQAHFAETTFTTSGQSAEVSAGGIRLNMIPNDGGNTFSGSFYAGVTDGAWQSNNLTPELRAKGLQLPTGITNIHDVNPAFGGPILRDRLWFFTSMRWTSVDELVVNAFMPDGSPAIVDQYVRIPLARLTYQVSPKNKFSIFLDRPFKYKGREFVFGIEPSRASRRRNPGEANYHNFGSKFTSTVSSRMLVEVGFTEIVERLSTGYQPAEFPSTRGWPEPSRRTCLATPCHWELDYLFSQTTPWYRDVSHFDIITNQRTVATTGYGGSFPDREHATGSVSYVTGTHNFKTGVQWSFGQDRNQARSHGDLVEQRYRLGVPEAVLVTINPYSTEEYVKADVGAYAQDTWTIDRLTVNAGVRYEYFNSMIKEQWAEAGRFVPARFFPEVPGLPIWHDVSPRFGLVYDLFGNAKTALKFSANKYARPMAGSFAKLYNPMRASGGATDTRDWFDCDLLPGTSTCSGRVLPTNRDDIVQDNEIGPPNNRNFGLAADRRPADDIKREYNVEYSTSVQHELLPRWSVTFGWYRRQYYRLTGEDNLLLDPRRDYRAFDVANPTGNGEIITLYNLDPAKRGLRSIVDFNSQTNTHVSNDVELSFNGTLPNGGTLFGSWNASRNETVTCDSDDPNIFNLSNVFTGTFFARGARFCDERKENIPFRHDFKLAGTYPLPYGLEFSGTIVSFSGNELQVVWNVPASLFPNGQRTQTVLTPLIPPGTKYLKQWNQVDVAVKKLFNVGGYQFVAQADVYNALNSSVVLTENENFGTSLGFPQTILQGRLLRLVGQVKF